MFISNSTYAEDLKIVIVNKTDQEIKIGKIISNYSTILNAYEFEEVFLQKDESRSIDVSIMSLAFFDLQRENSLKENDGIDFIIEGKKFSILWRLRPNINTPIFEPCVLSKEIDDNYKILKWIAKGGTFYIFIEKKVPLEVDYGFDKGSLQFLR
jgi:hypothetical protein